MQSVPESAFCSKARARLISYSAGLGPNLFYNSPMDACVVICCTNKSADRKGKVLFIDAVHEVARERAQSFLKPEHQARILAAYKSFTNEPGFANVATTGKILEKEGNLSIPRYVRPIVNNNGNGAGDDQDLKKAWASFEASGREFWEQIDELLDLIDVVIAEEVDNA
jgi:type I restriction enzyme M protein